MDQCLADDSDSNAVLSKTFRGSENLVSLNTSLVYTHSVYTWLPRVK